MTLDLSRLSSELGRVVSKQAGSEFRSGVQALVDAFNRADNPDLDQRLNSAKTSWLLARPVSWFNRIFPEPGPVDRYHVVASDGSFIAPDHHAAARYCVINTGTVSLTYDPVQSAAHLSSHPDLYVDDELYITNTVRRVPLQGAVLGVKRQVDELACLLDVLPPDSNFPSVALQDGTLILWALESQPDFVADWALERYISILDSFRERNVPVASFISYPASHDVLNSLRVSICDYPDNGLQVNCDHCRARILTEGHEPACSVIPDVDDRFLFDQAAGLEPGERTQVFMSSSSILKRYGDHAICFFYVNTDAEVARVEIPVWVAEDLDQLELVHAVVLDQARKGHGYPVALQEAHEVAVINSEERRIVDMMIEERLLAAGVPTRRSGKDLSKRGRFV